VVLGDQFRGLGRDAAVGDLDASLVGDVDGDGQFGEVVLCGAVVELVVVGLVLDGDDGCGAVA